MPNNKRAPFQYWSPEQVAFLKAHYNNGMSTVDIAAHVGFSTKKCCEMAYRLYKADPTCIKRKKKEIGEIVIGKDGKGREQRRMKTADGWVYLRLNEEDKLKSGGIRKSKFKSGDITKRRTGSYTYEWEMKSDGKWRRIPNPSNNKVKPLPNILNDSIMPKKPKEQQSKPSTSMDHSRNPDNMKIPVQSGGQWVRLNDRTIVYRKTAV